MLTVRFHSDGGPATFTGQMHTDFPRALAEIGDDRHLTFGIVPGDGIHLAWEEAIGLNRARYLTLTHGSFTAQQAERWGAVAEVLPLEQVLPRAQELAESLAAKPQLLTRYLAVTVRQRLSRRMAEATQLGMALEGLTAAGLAYEQH